ncbi:MAG: hypothetical protein Q8R67_15795 [Rhodoferax sp.]|nr:hypothetical protein [Rhodoferax sp.]MDP3653140.1 hypothetical protein [Rhodoferax sp.]
MKKHLFTAAFVLGAAAVVWVGSGFVGANLLALTMTAVIGAVYVFGALELRQFRQATATLATALAAIPEPLPSLNGWLANVHASLQNPVRLRIEGERIGLPGPALTPYLVGLLVMLGMLGTFLGMVVTLNGAVFALEGTTDLQAIRSALAAPIKGLGLAFGTSVAGVAASAMLGLMSALSRRERLQTAQRLDTQIATALRGFSLTHQRQETYKALQFQSQALPEVVGQLQAMMVQMERMGQQLNERLLSNQESFHSNVKGVYTDLARAVDQSLRDSLTQSAHVAGESLQPVVEAAMAGIAQEAKLMHERMVDTAQLQLDGLSARLGATAASLQAEHTANDQQRLLAWTQSLETVAATLHREWQHTGAQTLSQQQLICNTLTQTAQDITEQAQTSARQTLGEVTRLMTCSEDLVQSRIASEATWVQQNGERMDQLVHLLRTELGALREDEAQRGHAAVERLGDLQTALTHHLSTLGTALEDPITRLIQTASEAPRAAAEVIGQLRQEISHSVARDNALLEERGRIMETLNALLDSIHHASVEQRAVIDTLVASSAVALNAAGSEFSAKVGAEANKLSDIAAHVTSSAVEVSSLSEAFGFAVHSFNDANEKLIANLQRIEGAMDKSMARSDEQLAYYVAQAREIIDLSLMSQKEIFEELRQLPAKQAQLAEEVR